MELSDSLMNHFLFFTNNETGIGIFFNTQFSEFDIDNVKWVDNIPVLFPQSDIDEIFSVKGKSVTFNHDLISSAFFLLSGKQETANFIPDSYGRFPYAESVQYKLNIPHIPVVNYYFEWIIQGIEKFGELNRIEVKRKISKAPFTFALSHDIDRIDRYDRFYVAYHFKELLGIEKTDKTKYNALKDLAICTFEWVKGKKRKNPWWNFKEITDIENKLGIKSAFYFLPNHNYKVDAFYSLEEPRVIMLMNSLINNGFEVGMHGAMASANDEQVLKGQIQRLNKLLHEPISGNRQHNLSFKYHDTLKYLQSAGVKYDTTLGFAEHEGFRNSYCHPFKPFDFDNNEMLDIWEIPLVVMDATLFKYQKYSFEQANKAIDNLIVEIEKFGGVFSLLWHNSYYDNEVMPGIIEFYENMLERVMNKGAIANTAKNIIRVIDNRL